jgi:hypothetical protein
MEISRSGRRLYLVVQIRNFAELALFEPHQGCERKMRWLKKDLGFSL